MKIFVSHSTTSEESRRAARRFKELLLKCSKQKATVFLSSDSDSVPTGANWLQAIETALTQCDYFVALIREKADANKPWIIYEAGFVRGRGIFPKLILFHQVDPPDVPMPLVTLHLLKSGDTDRWLRDFQEMGLEISPESQKEFAALFEKRN